MSLKRASALTAALLGLALLTNPTLAQKKYGPGLPTAKSRSARTCLYSGPASACGTIGKVEAAYFRMINDQGGVNGRKINFITLIDAYSPPKTVEQVRRLVEQDEVLLLFQSLGTPANSAIHRWRFSRRSSPSAARQFRERSFKLRGPTAFGAGRINVSPSYGATEGFSNDLCRASEAAEGATPSVTESACRNRR